LDKPASGDLVKLGALGAFLAWWLPVAYLAAAVAAARSSHRFKLTSWLRAPGVKLPGGAGDASKHLIGWAVDLVPLGAGGGPATEEQWRSLAASMRSWPGIWVLDHTGTGRHLHCQIGRYPLKQKTP